MADPVGQQLGNYRIIRPIGRGGFADVYLGEHIYLKTQVAVKILQMRLTNEDMEGFLKEARTIAHFVHPHIVRVTDFGIEGGNTVSRHGIRPKWLVASTSPQRDNVAVNHYHSVCQTDS